MTTTLEPLPAETITRELFAYHSDYEHVSQTMLKVLDASPAEFYGRFVACNIPFKDTDAMKLGRCLHAKVLQPDLFSQLCPMMPDYHLEETNVDAKGKRSYSKSTKYYQDRKHAFESASAGRDVIDADDLVQIRGMANAIWNHDDAHAILSATGDNEVVHRWEDRIKRRGMLDADRVCSMRIIADIKKMNCPPSNQAFAMAAAKWRHFLQTDFYLDLAADLYGPGDYRFLFICVHDKPPHEVAIHELKPADLEKAGERVESLVTDLIRRRESGDWSADWQSGVNSVPLPKFVWSDFYQLPQEDDSDGN